MFITFKSNIQANFSVAKSIEDVKEGEHLVTLVNKVLGKSDPALGGGPAVVIASISGKNSVVQYGQSAQLAFHEVGHNFGFGHPDDDEPDYNTNPMGYAPNFRSGSTGNQDEKMTDYYYGIDTITNKDDYNYMKRFKPFLEEYYRTLKSIKNNQPNVSGNVYLYGVKVLLN